MNSNPSLCFWINSNPSRFLTRHRKFCSIERRLVEGWDFVDRENNQRRDIRPVIREGRSKSSRLRATNFFLSIPFPALFQSGHFERAWASSGDSGARMDANSDLVRATRLPNRAIGSIRQNLGRPFRLFLNSSRASNWSDRATGRPCSILIPTLVGAHAKTETLKRTDSSAARLSSLWKPTNPIHLFPNIYPTMKAPK